MRGEHGEIVMLRFWSYGSPPHARGAHLPQPISISWTRITPACAGSTAPGINTVTVTGDHPRMRGEHSSLTPEIEWMSGSPPHARGAP